MKKLMLLFIAAGVMACNSEEDTPTPDTIEVWNLTKIQRQLPANYNEGEVIWRFNMTKNTLQIENNVQDQHFEAGQYDFSMDQNSLTINNTTDTATFDLTSQANTRSLYHDPIPQAVDDEFTLVFDVE